MNQLDRYVQAFLGQRSAYDPSSLYEKKGVMAAQTNSFLLTKGRTRLDGQTGIGTNLATNSSTGLVGYGIDQYEWICSDGNTYHIFYRRTSAGACSVAYFVNGVRTGAPAALTYVDITGTALTPNIPSQTLPSWGVYGGALYLAMGQPGIFRITPSNGVLTAQLTIAPASSKMLIVDNRMWVAVGDEPIVRWSVLGDVERFTPKLAEIEAGTYGIDYRVTLQSEGVSGNIVDCKIFGKAKLFWTQNECFLIYGNGEPGTTVFIKVGAGMGSNGRAIVYEGACYWPSKYKGGSLRGFTFGAIPSKSTDVQTQDEKNIRFATFEASEAIADVFQAMPQSTIQNEVVSWDSKSDWDAIPSVQRTGLSTSYEPGNLLVQTTDASITPTWNVAIPHGGWKTTSGVVSYLNDSLPLYDSTSAPSVTSMVFGSPGPIWQVMGIYIYDSADKLIIKNEYNITAGWAICSIQQDKVARMTIEFQAYDISSIPVKMKQLWVTAFMASGYVDKIKILIPTAPVTSVTIDEIIVEGTTTSSATIYTELPIATSKAVLSGLTPSVNTDFGRFYASYVGTGSDGTGGVAFYVRAGNTPAATIETAGSFAGTGTTTFDGSSSDYAALGLKIGDYVTIGASNYYVRTVGTTTFTVDRALPASTTYFIYGTAPATWSTWTQVTGNDLLTGYDLKKLTYITGGASVKASAGGLLYVQVYTTLTISNGISPKIDAMFFTSHTGSNLTFGPAGYFDDKVFFSILSNSASTMPDCEVVRYLDGEHSVLSGKQAQSYLNTSDGDCLVCEGYGVGKQYQGSHNYTGADNSTETTLARIWEGQEDSGLLYGSKLRVEITGFNGAGSSEDAGYAAIDKLPPP